MTTRPRGGTLGNVLRTSGWLLFASVLAAMITGLGTIGTALIASEAAPGDLRSWADLGQACGAFSAVAAVAALGAFVFAFSVQQREAQEHRVELRLQRQALANSQQELFRAAETGLSMFHFRLIALSIENPNLAAVWPTAEPTLPEHVNQQYLYCTLMLEGVWLNARVGRLNETDVRAAVSYLLTSPVVRQYWQAFRVKRELVSATHGPESEYFKIVDEIYAQTDSLRVDSL